MHLEHAYIIVQTIEKNLQFTGISTQWQTLSKSGRLLSEQISMSLSLHEDRVAIITISMTKLKIECQKGQLWRNHVSWWTGMKDRRELELGLAVSLQTLDKWNEFLWNTLQWEAEPKSPTINWIKRWLQTQEGRHGGSAEDVSIF